MRTDQQLLHSKQARKSILGPCEVQVCYSQATKHCSTHSDCRSGRPLAGRRFLEATASGGSGEDAGRTEGPLQRGRCVPPAVVLRCIKRNGCGYRCGRCKLERCHSIAD